MSNPLLSLIFLHFIQDVISILNNLKNNFQVNEAILRVGVARRPSVPVPISVRWFHLSRKARQVWLLENFALTLPSPSRTLPKRSSRNGKVLWRRRSWVMASPWTAKVRSPHVLLKFYAESASDRKNSAASIPGTPITSTGSASKLETRSAKIDGIKGSSGDSTRDKCMTLIYDALAYDSGARQSLLTTLSPWLTSFISHRTDS